MGATSAGSIQMDLEVKSDLDEDIQAEARKLADRIRKQVDSMSGDMFKNLRQSLVASLDKMTEAVKSCLDRTKLEMRAFVEQMASMVKQMSGVQMPYQRAEDQSVPKAATAKSNPVRGPPSLSVRKPKIKFDPQFDTEIFKQKYMELEEMMDMYDNQILAKQAERKKVLETFTPNMNATAEETLNKQVMALDMQITKLQDAAERTNITLSAMDRQMATTSMSSVQASGRFAKFKSVLLGFAIGGSTGSMKRLNSVIGSLGSKFMTSTRAGSKLSGVINKFPISSSLATAGLKRLSSSMLSLASQGIYKLGQGLKNAGKHLVSFTAKLLGLNSSSKKASSGIGHASMGIGRLIKSFTIFSLIFPLVSRGIMALGQNLGATLMTNTAFANSLNQIRSNLATAFTPIFNAIMPALNALMSALSTITGYIAAFISSLFGKSYDSTKQATAGIYAAKDAMGAYGSSADKASKATEKARRSLMGFDEINKLDDKDSASGGDGGGSSKAPVYTPTDPNQNVVNKWVKKLKDLWSKGDYAGIGKVIGQQVNKAVTSFTKWISWDNVGTQITAFMTGFCELFNSLVKTINWKNIGKMFGTGINTIAKTIQLLMEGVNWGNIGKAIALGLNGLVHEVDWDNLGRTIGAYFQARINALYGFVTTANWEGTGSALANGVMGLVNKINWVTLGKTLGTGLSGLITTINNIITGIDWVSIGTKFGNGLNSFLRSVKWANAGKTLSNGLNSALKLLITTIATFDWVKLGQSIADFLCNINWIGLLAKLALIIGQAIVGLTKTILGFVAQLAKNIGEGFFNGLKEFFSNPIDWIKTNIVDPFINGIKDLFGIHSPSTVMVEIGGYLIQGLLNGIKSAVTGLIGLIPSIFGGIGKAIGGIWDGIKTTAGKAWKGITTTISSTWNGLKTKAGEVWGDIKKGISDKWDDLKEGAGKTWEGIKSTVCEKLGLTKEGVAADTKTMFNTMSSIGDDIKNVVGNKSKSTADKFGENMKAMKTSAKNVDIKSAVKSSIDKALNWIGDSAKKTAESRGKSMMLGMSNGTKKVSIKSAVETTVNKATSWLKGLKNLSPTWGKDMMSGMSEGMRNATYLVSNAASNAANIISQWLHFSRPDVGPLREYEKWMPDMMQGLSSTLESSTPTFINRVKTLATSMSSAMQASLQEPTIAFAGEQSLNVQHEWKEEHQSKEASLKDVIDEIKNLKQKFDEIKQAVENKDTDVYMDSEKVTKKVVDNVNKDTRKNGKCPIDM
ncbi:phage tail protein [Longicatena caecimuris]|uniref:Phage-related protein n=1 Tax=Longicatena caecimuris TaxID=1796635 RepID=A0A4R3TDI6_9FIRM|nr:hypothetical protein [Longicatena caecimuris]MCR1870177.1 hypothetical protein [Longicatena caecimuris]MCU0102694.1 hypothetical protein [Longicatena caecimuris]TCU60023.1 phage-related protein [Longicatena caecimuris]